MRIFVVGCARTGTTWVGRILASHPEIAGLVEDSMIFPWVVDAASRSDARERLLPEILRRYRVLGDLAAPRHLSTKDHPALWFAEELAEEFPDARFVALRRDVKGTVASMFRHEAALRWSKEYDRYPLPNPFLGATEDWLEWFKTASLASRCAARWKAHDDEITRLQDVLGDRMISVRFEFLVRNYEEQLQRLNLLLGLRPEFFESVEAPNPDALEKWKRVLSEEDLEDIEKAIS